MNLYEINNILQSAYSKLGKCMGKPFHLFSVQNTSFATPSIQAQADTISIYPHEQPESP